MAGSLLASRRFGPLFLAQMLGALNDNLFKNALVVLILFRGSGTALLVPLAGGIFILPYALFSAVAGQLADRTDKARLIRLTKAYEVALMGVAGLGFLLASEPVLLIALFGLGVQATFFGPLKYGILPEQLAADELLRGNSLVEASTFIGILAGTVLGGLLILLPHGGAIVAACALTVAALGLLAGWLVPLGVAAAPGLRLGLNVVAETRRLLAHARAAPVVWRSILGLSWFWALGAAFLAEFPLIVKQDFAGDGAIVTLMLAVFSVGVGGGSMLSASLLRGAISARHVPAAAIAIGVFALDFAWRTSQVTPATGWHDVAALLATAGGWRVLIDLFGVAAAGGVFSVPLYALLQSHAEPAWRARMVAANNVMNALFMVVAAVVLAAGAALRASPSLLLGLLALTDLAVALAIGRARLP